MSDKYFRLEFLHVSMQYSDNTKQKQHDVDKIFAQKAHIITGTEAGTGSSKDLRRALKRKAKEKGYTFKVKGDGWICVDKSIMDKRRGIEKGAVFVLEGKRRAYTHKYVVYTSFNGKDGLGRISISTGHYLTKGSPKWGRQANIAANRLYAKAIGRWARKYGKGSALAYYAGDQNIPDRLFDTFFGEPLTSSWDELKRWDNTGHGNIDVIASYDRDGRTEWVKAEALEDKEFFLHTDHFAVRSVARVKLLDSTKRK